jgi:type II secretory pathway component GspD/PulD (secretin)
MGLAPMLLVPTLISVGADIANNQLVKKAIKMKMKTNLLGLAGFLATALIGVAQTNPPAADAPAAPAVVTAPVNPPAPVVSAAPGTLIPLIVMDEVPLTDAIKNLARQAGLNYMLDPKIPYGATGPDGKPIPQPLVSLRWENITPDQALAAVLNNYNLQLVEDPKTRTVRVTVRDPAAPEPLIANSIQLKYANPTNIIVSVQTVLTDKRSRVVPDNRTTQLVLLCTQKEYDSVIRLINQLDTPTKQVLIEAKMVETSKNPTSTKGVDWTGTFSGQNVTFGNGQTVGQYGSTVANVTGAAVGATAVPFAAAPPQSAGAGSGPINGSGSSFGQVLTTTIGGGGLGLNTAKGFFPNTAFLNANGLSAVLNFLNSSQDTEILSTPRAVTLDNETATLAVTTAEPIFATTAGTQGSPGGAQVTYTNVGTILKVTPRVSANRTINLKVVPEVSDIGGVITKTISGEESQADFFDVRTITTQVLIPSGNTLVMGGLVSDNRTRGTVKVPILGDIPYLGALFRNDTKSQIKKDLIIFVTPTIVEEDDFQPAPTAFLKTTAPTNSSIGFGPWDSSAKQDWSKLTSGGDDSGTAKSSGPKWPPTE